MPLRVDFKKKTRIGYYKVKQGDELFRIDICPCNTDLWAEIWFHEDEKHSQAASLMGFFDGLQHLKNCNESFELFCTGGAGKLHGPIVFYAKNMTSEHWKAVKYLTNNKTRTYKVSIR